MRNYIILNGVNSNTITGLLISTLPPITKPKIRTQTEEIDGRDGDIVTKLGYSAYDKTIEIGLYGDFNIDEVIAYFNSEGTIVFSNEPDKYYNYQILDQIDYEKLIRFKTANVKMHVQPFKYPLEETPVEINIQNVTGSGETISLDNTAEAPLTLALKGNTSQDGTPTPTAPVEVKTVTGGQQVVISKGTDTQSYELDLGKNLFDISTITVKKFAKKSDGSLGTSDDWSVSDYIEVQPNTNYIYSGITNSWSGSAGTVFYDSSKTYISSINSNVYTFTTPATAKYVRISLNSETPNNIQLEKGDTASSFAPYKTPIELCKIGNYQDRIYKNGNKWYLEKNIGKVVLDSTYRQSGGTTGTNAYYISTTINGLNDNSLALSYSNMFQPCSFNNRANGLDITYLQNGNLAIRTANNTSLDWSDNTKRDNWLNANKPICYYVLATPTTTEITDIELIGQLEALKQARSYDTTTNISQNTANKPFILNATAVQKGTDTATVDNEGNIYAKPTIDIEGSGAVEVYLNNNQIFTIDLSNNNECIIDTTNLEAYDPDTSQLMNRQVTGDYSNFVLNTGENQVKVSGNVTKATISNYTRWL